MRRQPKPINLDDYELYLGDLDFGWAGDPVATELRDQIAKLDELPLTKAARESRIADLKLHTAAVVAQNEGIAAERTRKRNVRMFQDFILAWELEKHIAPGKYAGFLGNVYRVNGRSRLYCEDANGDPCPMPDDDFWLNYGFDATELWDSLSNFMLLFCMLVPTDAG